MNSSEWIAIPSCKVRPMTYLSVAVVQSVVSMNRDGYYPVRISSIRSWFNKPFKSLSFPWSNWILAHWKKAYASAGETCFDSNTLNSSNFSSVGERCWKFGGRNGVGFVEWAKLLGGGKGCWKFGGRNEVPVSIPERLPRPAWLPRNQLLLSHVG